MSDLALRFFSEDEIKGAKTFRLLSLLPAQGVEPVVVQVLHAASLQLPVKERRDLLP